MEWWAIVTGGIGAICGIYGAVRSFRTDRRLHLLEDRWVIERTAEKDAYDLTSRLGHIARAVRVEGEGQLIVKGIDGRTGDVPPGDSRRVLVLVPWSEGGRAIVVRWQQRVVFVSRDRQQRVPLPR